MKTTAKSGGMGDDLRRALVGVEAKTAAKVGAGWWDLREGADGKVVSMQRKRKRILGEKGRDACYHVMSRTVGGDVFFDDVEKEALRKLIWKMARFSMVKVVTYAVMGNHFHVLAVVPDAEKTLEKFRQPGGEKLLLKHISCLYSLDAVQILESQLQTLRKRGEERARQEIIERLLARMCDVSRFVNEVKVRFTRWYNRRHDRKGTLWMERFKSVLIGSDAAMRSVALYIDLNPVRAGLVDDPVNYRWCGWAEAEAGGSRRARRGICKAVHCAVDSWERGDGTARKLYRDALDCVMEREGKSRFVEDEARKPGVMRYLLRRTRYFSDSLVIGTKGFVENALRRHSGSFSERRRTLASPMRAPDGGGRLRDDGHFTLKNLIKEAWG
ncbi:transposase [Sulfuriroseicoccus oceanibius]|uniref:Transposase IS200-like domain-containing protein n=1 Tax=Sulfuriroseicoccus oceanibius TaxID=2707525 RepID=A0A6B3L6Y3_9BACT|nr:transposase [Sulfuriroseicoccus oceanibius]QQL45601.1 hypothetical protein G3M56_003150 [Sulfuriroseicoccus oceanibius]